MLEKKLNDSIKIGRLPVILPNGKSLRLGDVPPDRAGSSESAGDRNEAENKEDVMRSYVTR